MKYTKKLTNMELSKKESQAIATQLEPITWEMVEMSTPTLSVPRIDDDAFFEKMDLFDAQHKKHSAYLDLQHAIFKFAHCERRSFKMYTELEHAIKQAEDLELNVY